MSQRNVRKTRVGIVVSDKMDKTVVVAIADNDAGTSLSQIPFAHTNSSFRYASALSSRSRMIVLTMAISLRTAFRRIGFSS